ncbi:MAG: hybrid sensor histidine kinase/response regulator [Proteobacteria bacterium]|nr:hybrid sensor histidine kinase/response regulator [Pseudomonadota bacterium]
MTQDHHPPPDSLLDFVAEEESIGDLKLGQDPTLSMADRWQILIVDDEQDIHSVTAFALNNYIYMNRRLHFISAFSEVEARAQLSVSPNIALVLLDVVMSTPDAGLKLVKFIREDLNNQQIQIILRTGQPGDIPEEQMVKRYNVNDYKLKTELTREKLFSAVTLALRSFQQMRDLADLNFKLCTANNQLAVFNAQLQGMIDARTGELQQQSQNLTEALQDKTNLLRIVAHDLRNYLTIAKWSSELATRAESAELSAKHLAKVAWAIDKQSELINKVVSLEAVRSGKQVLNCQSESLSEILKIAAETFEQRLKEKGLGLEVHWHCPGGVQVWVDRVIFSNSVINNVVSNAIKFSHEGDIIRIDVHHLPEGNVCISVRDQGIGIPDSVMQALFGFEVQTSRTGTKGERGTGFGMPIAKLLLEKMDGSIAVKSKVMTKGSEDHGTEVMVTVMSPKAS